MMGSVIDWLATNKEWFFSGAGVTMAIGLISGVWWLLARRKRRSVKLHRRPEAMGPPLKPQTQEDEEVSQHGRHGSINRGRSLPTGLVQTADDRYQPGVVGSDPSVAYPVQGSGPDATPTRCFRCGYIAQYGSKCAHCGALSDDF